MSGWYLDGKQQLLARTVSQASAVYALGVNDEYVYDATHTSLAPTVGHELLPEQALAGVSFDGGELNAADTVWNNVGANVLDRSLILKGVIIYFKNDTTPVLLAYIDSASAGLPQTLTGENVTARWDARGILKL